MLENVIAVILNERDNEITRINAEIVEVLKWLNEAGKKEINRLLYANRYQLELETSIEGVLHLIKSCRLHTSYFYRYCFLWYEKLLRQFRVYTKKQ